MGDLLEVGAYVLVVLISALWAWREERWLKRREREIRQHQLAAEREAARQIDGLPPHPYCLCPKCRSWRLVEGNSERLRLRGRR